MIPLILALVATGFAIGLAVTHLARAVGRRTGAVDSAGAAGHEKELRGVPNNGGIAIYLALAVPIAVGLIAAWTLDAEWWSARVPAVAGHLERIRQSTPTACAMLVCMTVLHVLGAIDDRRSLGPIPKLAAQVAVAATMAIWFEVRLLERDPIPAWGSILLAIVWIVAVTNAINFMDNMDGLAAGVSGIAAALFMVACIVNHQWFIASTLALLIGALAGFLVFNFPPATIFMGDRGSLVIGFVLAVLTVRTTYVHPELGGGWYGVFMPLVVLAIPLYDLVTVTLIRIRQGRSPFVGDQQHFSHRLVLRGMSTRGAVIVIWSATAVTGIGGVALGSLQAWQAVLVAAQTMLVLVMIALLEHASRRAIGKQEP
jgi:UDP-GlcNAc:undecaprenyl-phosphate GlcNAc-1-phosphate transferase